MISRHATTKAFADLLATATGRPVGQVTVPTSGGVTVPPPYYILNPVDWRPNGPALADLNPDATAVYQVDCVSGPDPADPDSRGGIEQAEWLADKARTAVLARDPATGVWVNQLAIPGAANTGRAVDIEPGATSAPEDAIIHYVIRFSLDLTAA